MQMREDKNPVATENKDYGGRKGTARWQETALLLILAVFIVVFLILVFGKTGVSVKIIKEGDIAPEFSLPSVDGSTVRLSDYRGKVVMLHFWATWCPPCVEEIPALDYLYRTLKGKDFDVITVSVDEGGASAVRSFMQKRGLVLPVALDPDRSVAAQYGTFKFPETYVIDREGIVRLKVVGSLDWTFQANIDRVRSIIDRL